MKGPLSSEGTGTRGQEQATSCPAPVGPKRLGTADGDYSSTHSYPRVSWGQNPKVTLPVYFHNLLLPIEEGTSLW